MTQRFWLSLLAALTFAVTASAQSSPPTIQKVFGSSTIPLNSGTSLTFTITNPNATPLTGVGFNDPLPSGLQVSASNGITGACEQGVITANPGDVNISLSGAGLAGGESCTFGVNVTGIAAGVQNNTTSVVTATESGDGANASATVTVIAPPTITKAFGAPTIPLNGATSLSFTVGNPNANQALTGVAFSDVLPSGLQISTPSNGLSGTCGSGTITANPGDTSLSLSGANLDPATSCTFSINVTGIAAGVQANTTSAISSNEGGTGATSNTALLTVVAQSTVAIAFSPSVVPVNGTSTLTFTVSNPDANQTETGIGFTDTLPAGLTVSSPNNGLNATCTGTITAIAASNNIALSGQTLAAGASCTFSVNVTGTLAGAESNATGAISSNEAGTGAASNTAILYVAVPPAITATFSGPSVALNGSTTLTFTITNPNAVPLSGVGVTDTLPAGLMVSTPSNGLAGSCGAGSITAAAGSNSVILAGGSIAAASSCSFSVSVTGTVLGAQNNTTSLVSSNEGGAGAAASGSITVLAPPSISKWFAAGRIPFNTTISLSFQITNPASNSLALTGVGFTDTFPSGLVVATPNGQTGTCGGGGITALPGSNQVTLSGATLAANGSCTFSVNVRGTLPIDLTNTTGNVTSTNGGNGNTASASLAVTSTPSVSIGFEVATVPLNGVAPLFFTVNNPNATVTLTGIAFSDTLPAGLTVSSPNGISGTCGGGTITAIPGTNSIALSGATLAGNGFCTFSVNVTGLAAGTQATNTGPISANETGAGAGSNIATLAVALPPVIAAAFGAATVPLNGSTSLTFTITNPAVNTVPLTGAGFTDTLPAGLLVASPNNLSGSCSGGSITAVAGSNSVALTGATLGVNTACTFSVNVTGTVAGVQNLTTSAATANESGPGATASASVTVVAPPSISKSFGAPKIALNGNTSLTFTITNPGVNPVSLTGVGFTDTFPSGMQVATPNGLSGACGAGAINTGTNSVSLAGATLAANATCTFSVNVTGTAGGSFTNTTGNVTSSNGGNGNTASANLSVVLPPTLSTAFTTATVALNGTTTLSFTVTNPNATQPLSGIAFSDTLPAGLQVSAPTGITGTCGSGTITANPGGGSIGLSSGTLAAGASCTFSLSVTGEVAGPQTNTTSALSSTEGGTGGTASASVTVIAPPTITKAFGAASFPLTGSTSLSFTVANPPINTIPLTAVAFTDTLPAGLAVANPNGLAGSCGGSVTAGAGSNSVSLSGGTIPVSGSCTFSVNVTGTAAGAQNNTTGAVSSLEGGTGGTAQASTAVLLPPSISKSFGAARIPLNGNTTLSFTITNPGANVAGLNGVAFTDTFPAGIAVANPNGLSGACGIGASVTAVAGSNSVSLAGGSIATGGTCTLTVNVTGAAGGDWTNTTGAVTSTNGGTGNTASANLSVTLPPAVTQVFNPASIPQNGTTTLSFTVNNTNTSALTGIAFTDTLPAGLQVSAPNNGLTGTCGTITALAGASNISLSGASLAPGTSCTFSISLTGTTAGTLTNTTGAVSATETGAGVASSASLMVVAPPTIAKTFGAPTILLNASTTLSFTITNPTVNTISLTQIGFNDTLPSGLTLSTPAGLTGDCGGGTITAADGGTLVSLSGATLAANASCTFSVNVTGMVMGVQNNTTDSVTSKEGGSGGTATASVAVVVPPVITAGFAAPSVALNGSTSLIFTISNVNTIALTNVTFNDALPAGLLVSAPNNGLTGSCGAGTIVAVAGSNSIGLAGAALPPATQCTFSVNVTGIAAGNYANIAGPVSSTEAGIGNAATANLSVLGAPSIMETFSAATVALNASANVTFTISNPNAGGLSGVGFVDTLPAGLRVSSPGNGLTGSCGAGAITANAGGTAISLAGAALASGGSCTFSVSVTGTAAGLQTNLTGAVTANESGPGGTASSSITVVAPPSITTAFGSGNLGINASTTLSFTITNPNASVSLTGIGFTDTLPSGLVISTPNGISGSCGSGTITATAGASVISLSGATLAGNSACTFSVSVTAIASGAQSNSTGSVTSNEGGAGASASASTTVVLPPTITKSFGASRIPLSGSTSLSFTITNPAANVATLTGVGFTDTFPAGLLVASPNGLTGSCGSGTITAVGGSNSVVLSGASLASGASCTFSVNVKATFPVDITNTTAVTSSNGGNGNTASANLSAIAPPTITTSFSLSTIPLNGTTALSFALTNTNASHALSGIGFSDTLPTGLIVSSPNNGLTGSCAGGTITATAGSNSISLSGASLNGNASCTFSVNVTGTASGALSTTTSAVTSTEGGAGLAASASITVIAPPTITKTFGAANIAVNGTTSLSFTIVNPAANSIPLTGIGVTDTLPAGLVVASPNGLTGLCGGGSVSAVAGSNSVVLSGATLAAGAQCTFSVNVTATATGAQNNTTGAVTSNEGANGGTASASILVLQPPSISMSFTPTKIPLNGNSSLSFTIANPAANTVALSGMGFTDGLPAGLLIATPNGLTGTCGGGTITATAGSNSVSLAGATLASGASCTFGLNVKGTLVGDLTNVTGAVTSTNGGTGNTASALLSVMSPPSITVNFGAATIPLNGTTTLGFTISNPNASQGLTGVAFSDALPSGLVVSTPNGITGSCGGGTIAATPGAASLSLAAASLPASGTCAFSVNVTGVTAGAQQNTTGAISSNETGAGTASNAATLTVVAPPNISKTFGGSFVTLLGTTTLSFTVTNPNATTLLTGIGFNDTLPVGLIISSPNSLTGGCGGGSITATAGSNSITLAGAALSASSSCTFSVKVTAVSTGVQNNITSAVTSNEGGNGATASASVTAAVPPSITKSFGASTIGLQATTSLTFTIMNSASNTTSLTGIGFTDTFPSGLLVATPNGLTGSCGGGTITAVAGSNSVALAGASLPPNTSCTFSVTVLGAVGVGNVVNVTSPVTSTNGGTGNTASAPLNIDPPLLSTPPTITKNFGALTVGLNATTSLTISLQNPNSGSLSNVAFTDPLPSGLVVATPNGLVSTCNGSNTALAGSTSVGLSNGMLAAGAGCTITVNVTATSVGLKNNTTSTVTSTEAPVSLTASASITVTVAPPSLSMSFGSLTMPLNATTLLSFNLTNPNSGSGLSSVSFTGALPAGLVIATPNGLSNSCSGATVTAAAGSHTISVVGGTLAASGSCNVNVSVLTTALGLQTATAGPVTSFEGGMGNSASASVTVGQSLYVGYVANLPAGDSVIDITNTNESGGNICANVYAFDPSEEMVACCSCMVTPDALVSLSARNDLISNTLVSSTPTSIVIKVLSTSVPSGSYCNAGLVSSSNLTSGMSAWGTSLHAGPSVPITYSVTERPFSSATLSPVELSHLGQTCLFIQTNGTGFGVCKSCSAGGQGATGQQ